MTNNTPDHYKTKRGFDVFDVADAYNLSHRTAVALKYICRAGKKENNSEIDDYKKAIDCLDKQIKFLKEQ